MRRAAFLLTLLALIATGTPVLADGKFYATESIPPDVPYQRALIMFDGGVETLLVQSAYRASGPASEAFGWVVPVPSAPELASMDLQVAEQLFRGVDWDSRPKVTRLSDVFLPLVLIVVPLAAVLILLAGLLSLLVPRMPFVPRHRGALVTGAALILLPVIHFAAFELPACCPCPRTDYTVSLLEPVLSGLVLLLCLLSTFLSPLQRLRGSRVILVTSSVLSLAASFSLPRVANYTYPWERYVEPVEAIKTERVGIYSVQVVKAGRAEDLIEWLDRNAFQFDANDRQVIDDYLERGWVFVTARTDPAVQEPVPEALVAPLVMRFQADAPVYPLALTSTAGSKTEILLYLVSQHKVTSQGRLELLYAGNYRSLRRALGQTQPPIDPPGFFDEQLALPYLCKFKGTLSPEQMEEDLVFVRAGDDKPYRKHVVTW